MLLAVGASLGATARAEEPVPVSRLVSSDAVIYAEMPRPAVLLDRAGDARVKALVDALPPAKAALGSEPIEKLREGVRFIAEKIGKPWDEALRDLTGGGAVFVVEVKAGEEPAVALVVTPKDPELLKKTCDTIVELAKQDPNGDVQSAEHRGFTGYKLGPKFCFAVIKDRLVISDRPEVLKGVVDRTIDGLPAGGTIEDTPAWAARKASVTPDTLAWGVARLDRLRELDPNRFQIGDKVDPRLTLAYGAWVDTLRQAPWVSASLSWTDSALHGSLAMPSPKEPRSAALKGFLPSPEGGAPAPLRVPRSALSVSLWRDLGAIWNARGELFRPEEVEKLDEVGRQVGEFFGGRDFGKEILGGTTPDWRMVVALQDPETLKPRPEMVVPAIGVVFDLKPGDDELPKRLKVAFQSLVGHYNAQAANDQAPPFELGTETFEGVTIETARFLPPAAGVTSGPVHLRHNFSPAAALVGRHYVVCSSVGLARDLVTSLKAEGTAGRPGGATVLAEADGAACSKFFEQNRKAIAEQNMREKGYDRERAEAEVDVVATVLKFLGHGRLTVKDGRDVWRTDLEFQLGR